MDLMRFVTAQDEHATYAQALAELRQGRKTGHWMWFVFPQLTGLGRSSTAQYYAIADLDEATAYLAHPVLGPRLLECTDAVLEHTDLSATEIFGEIDAMKLRSSMTLFARADQDQAGFPAVLDLFFESVYDEQTEQLLEPSDPS